MSKKPAYEYKAKVVRVLDGDTFECLIDLGCDVKISASIRMHGINAQEVHDKDSDIRVGALKAKDYLKSIIDGKEVILKTYKGEEKYGRYLADVYIPGEPDLFVNGEMIKSGNAVAYDGGKR